MTTKKAIRHEPVTHLNKMITFNKKKNPPRRAADLFGEVLLERKSLNCRNIWFFQLQLNRVKQIIKTSPSLANRQQWSRGTEENNKQAHVVPRWTRQKVIFKIKLLTSDINYINVLSH